jgi:protein phosphatase
MVCDGVGGESQGEVASRLVCTTLRAFLEKEKPLRGQEKECIQKAIQYANQQLITYAASHPSAARMSTTLALVWLAERSVITAWCGDTRIHHIRKGRVLWKSRDHSLVSELVSRGEISEEEARVHPQKNIITRCLNPVKANNTVDFHEIRNFQSGDYLLLCSDGLLEKINEEAIGRILGNEKEPDKAKGFLSCCQGVTRDNYSMYLIQARQLPPPQPPYTWGLACFLLLGLILLFLILLYQYYWW